MIITLSVYLSLLIFLVAIVARGVRIVNTPIHLRWELYPVPHEKGRSQYGGSRMEEVDWWTKPAKKDSINELVVMLKEILLLKGVWEHNRPLWFGSWTLHFSLYLLIGLMGLQVLSAILLLSGFSFYAEIPELYRLLLKYIAATGFTMGTVGAVIMLKHRMFDKKLRMYNTKSHFFNIIHLGAIYVSGIFWMIADGGFVEQQAELFKGVLSFSQFPAVPTAGIVHVAIVMLFFVYLPFTHMTHFFTKYFIYHDIRWEDKPNIPGGKIEKRIVEAVTQPVSWSAPHIKADGKKTWADLVAMTGAEKEEEV
ncbi:MAG: respiratory nitrate reductase subunit gamma [Candidatus Electryonea clarkiae]|nr:respiratory nitrate reductase subunit gamma [Candidatus Electryonea clarkiae]MDP8286500.1 respiratory nitrate reductase subunit gamma [Candidatus Electryonea clarkiae]